MLSPTTGRVDSITGRDVSDRVSIGAPRGVVLGERLVSAPLRLPGAHLLDGLPDPALVLRLAGLDVDPLGEADRHGRSHQLHVDWYPGSPGETCEVPRTA